MKSRSPLALFTHPNTTIARLHGQQSNLPLATLLASHSLALSHTNSTAGNHVPKYFLATNGLYATNLAGCVHLAGQRKVIDAVCDREFDFGAANLELVDDVRELRVIARLAVSDLGLCWVAGKRLDDTIEKHLREFSSDCAARFSINSKAMCQVSRCPTKKPLNGSASSSVAQQHSTQDNQSKLFSPSL